MKIHESDIPFERSRVYKIKIGIDSKKGKKDRIVDTNIPTNDHLCEMQATRFDSTIKKIVSPIIPKFSPIPTSRDQFTAIKGD